MSPVFRPDGTVTAGNACPLNDGAAAVVVMSDTRAKSLGLEPIARIVASGVSALNPEIMGLGPIDACRQAMGRAGLTIDALDQGATNEAFAAQSIPCIRELEMDVTRVNPNGGAIALGHPLGCSGARISTTLLHEMKRRGAKHGLATMCVGVGQGVATRFEM